MGNIVHIKENYGQDKCYATIKKIDKIINTHTILEDHREPKKVASVIKKIVSNHTNKDYTIIGNGSYYSSIKIVETDAPLKEIIDNVEECDFCTIFEEIARQYREEGYTVSCVNCNYFTANRAKGVYKELNLQADEELELRFDYTNASADVVKSYGKKKREKNFKVTDPKFFDQLKDFCNENMLVGAVLSFKCGICNRNYKTKENLLKHIGTNH